MKVLLWHAAASICFRAGLLFPKVMIQLEKKTE